VEGVWPAAFVQGKMEGCVIDVITGRK